MSPRHVWISIVALSWLNSAPAVAYPPSFSIGKFPQEVPQRYTQALGKPLVDCRCIFIDSSDRLHLRTADRYLIRSPEGQWTEGGTEQFPIANQVVAHENHFTTGFACAARYQRASRLERR